MALTCLVSSEGTNLERFEKVLCEAAEVPITLANTRILAHKALVQFANARVAELAAKKEPPVEL